MSQYQPHLTTVGIRALESPTYSEPRKSPLGSPKAYPMSHHTHHDILDYLSKLDASMQDLHQKVSAMQTQYSYIVDLLERKKAPSEPTPELKQQPMLLNQAFYPEGAGRSPRDMEADRKADQLVVPGIVNNGVDKPCDDPYGGTSRSPNDWGQNLKVGGPDKDWASSEITRDQDAAAVRRRRTFVNKGQELAQMGSSASSFDRGQTEFQGMDLKRELVRGISAYGLERPAAIQQRAIPLLLRGNNLVAHALPSNEKVASYVIPILEKFDPDSPDTFAVILVPSSELAKHVKNVITNLSRYFSPALNVSVCAHAIDLNENLASLADTARPPNIIVGTLSRVHELQSMQAIDTVDLRFLVVDEAEKLLTSKTFRDQINTFLLKTLTFPDVLRTAVYASKLPSNVNDIIDLFHMQDPISVIVKKDEMVLRSVQHYYIYMSADREEWTLDTLCDVFEDVTYTQAVVFCHSPRKVKKLAIALAQRGIDSVTLEPESREADVIIRNFREGRTPTIVASEQMAKALSEAQVSLVINYDLPDIPESYMARITCAGRNPKRIGMVINFVDASSVRMLKTLEHFYQITIEEMPMDAQP